MPPLTPRQRRVLAFLKSFSEEHKFPPTHAEIAEALGFRSPNAAAEHLRLMAKKGVIDIQPGVARGLRILDCASGPRSTRGRAPSPTPIFPHRRGDSALAPAPVEMPFGLPVIGQVAAGQPVLAEQNIERTVAVDPGLFRPRADYLLRVRGDSMIEAGILPGDLVAVHRTRGVHDREIAVVRLEDEVTVKRWSTAGRGADVRVVLEPANAALAPIVVDPRRMTVAVEGLVVGLVRPDVAGRGAR